jgi:hypothetical protein
LLDLRVAGVPSGNVNPALVVNLGVGGSIIEASMPFLILQISIP